MDTYFIEAESVWVDTGDRLCGMVGVSKWLCVDSCLQRAHFRLLLLQPFVSASASGGIFFAGKKVADVPAQHKERKG